MADEPIKLHDVLFAASVDGDKVKIRRYVVVRSTPKTFYVRPANTPVSSYANRVNRSEFNEGTAHSWGQYFGRCPDEALAYLHSGLDREMKRCLAKRDGLRVNIDAVSKEARLSE